MMIFSKLVLTCTVLLVRDKRHFMSKAPRLRHFSLCSLALEPKDKTSFCEGL